MKSGKVVVASRVGLHARPASLLSKKAKGFESSVRIKFGEKDVDGKSILSVLTLGVAYGEEVEIITDGPDEEVALAELIALVKSDAE